MLGQALELRNERTEEFALELGHDGTDDPAFGSPEIRGERIRPIAERRHRGEDTLRILPAHRGDAVHHFGNRGGRNTGAHGDIMDGGAPLLAGCSMCH